MNDVRIARTTGAFGVSSVALLALGMSRSGQKCGMSRFRRVCRMV